MEKIHHENQLLLVEKSELNIENQALKTLLTDDKIMIEESHGLSTMTDVFKCKVSNIIFDILFTIIVERRKTKDDLLSM